MRPCVSSTQRTADSHDAWFVTSTLRNSAVFPAAESLAAVSLPVVSSTSAT